MAFTLTTIALVLAVALGAKAETHTITFDNQCGTGTPILLQGGNVLPLVGNSYTADGQINSAIAYLQRPANTPSGKECNLNGENCTLIELNMANPTTPGSGPSVDISLIAPHVFSVPAGFHFTGGDGSCNGIGAFCASATCNTAFFKSDDNQVQVACQADNVNLVITFCGDQETGTSSGSSESPSPVSTHASVSTSVVNSSATSCESSTTVTSESPSPTSTHASASTSVVNSLVTSSASSTTVSVTLTSTLGETPTPSPAVNVVESPSASSVIATTSSSAPASATTAARTCRRKRSTGSTGSLAHARSRARAQAFHH